MDEQQARQRLLEGGYFVALGVPPGVDFGIDVKSYQVCASTEIRHDTASRPH